MSVGTTGLNMGDGLARSNIHSWSLLAPLKKSTESFSEEGREEEYFKYIINISF